MTDRNANSKRGKLRGLIAAALVTTSLAGALTLYNGEMQNFSLTRPAEAAPATAAFQTPGSFADLAERVKPSVVQITTTQVEKAEVSQVPPELRGTPFEDFFRRFGGQRGPSARRGHALGSGFVVDPSGYIVTNNHVIGHATEISVALSTGEKYPAKLIGHDEKTDLALLKIEPKQPLKAVNFGGDDTIRVGDWVMAVGNPFGLDGTVTVGVLSARGRDLGSGPFDDFLQIDAPINSGNSGGPTFDAAGRVVGVNTAIVSPNGGSVGIGFAIPASIARPVIEQLRDKGKVERGWLGVQMQPVTDDLAKALGIANAHGALVAAVQPDSPAQAAGIRQGDVILGLGSENIDSPRDLARAVAGAQVNKTTSIVVQRAGEKKTLSVKLGVSKTEEIAAVDTDRDADAKIGLALAPLDPQARTQLGLGPDIAGAVVTNIDPESPAADTGIRPGDVIAEVGGAKVKSPSEVASAIRKERSESKEATALLVLRNGVPHYVALPLGRA